ncbi:aminotransferase class III-fold pyridoxal phosphate-dependent enzyme [Conexibacter woesei]|uniref:Aminotransferase class-III n=1 Tax=Conexibacter woesei (strain DSM 14684 / CCUG 47730 / CIP 108061 / JCM 11494 / NBRC 100937 / ID131577) TaxID=469383 RepID=D3F5K4_CONWI|nr:aminotransferase class III-fold pyridoxal phosphate-dependent enzyme [Conexibacter woesei]ADB50671.1 aminotransferase class-III [Conexibacter woesei DSM 14684]
MTTSHAVAVDAGQAQEIAERLYGLRATASPLPGEQDLNFRLRTDDGTSYILKLHHPSADAQELDLQDQALLHVAAAPGAPPAPRVLSTADGRTSATVAASDGERVARLLSWVPGRPWADVARDREARWDDVGRHVADVDRALRDFRHPAMDRELLWNLTSAPVVAQFAALVDAEKRPAVERVFERYERFVAPRLDALPHQVVHNDANELNILVDDGGAVSGLIDFGDVVWSARVCGLAVAGAYAMQGHRDAVATVVPLVRGYDRVTPLGVGELEVLFDLMRTRMAMSICMSAWQHSRDPSNDYLLVSQQGMWGALRRLTDYDAELAHFRFRDACGYEPNPAARRIRQHVESGAARLRPLVRAGVESAVLAPPDQLGSVPGAALAIGRYGDQRDHEGSVGSQLGVELFLAVGEPVFAPLDGVVAESAVDALPLSVGGIVLLEHRTADGTPFWTRYRQLDRASAARWAAGDAVRAGERLGAVGSTEENGGRPPHVHVQLLTGLGGEGITVPAVAPPDELDLWRSVSPDPNLLLGRRGGVSARVARPRAELLRRRGSNLSRALSLAYDEPLQLVHGKGAHLYDQHGRAWLDLVNNVCHVGHCHPRVVAAGQRQMAQLNTNTRYLHDTVVDYALRLAATLPDPLRVLFFVNSGSEANDLALRLAQAHTGRRDVLVLDHAYHGHLGSQIALSPYKFDGRGGEGRAPHTHVCELPDPYRGRLRDKAATGAAYARDVEARVAELAAAGTGPAAFFAESLQSCGGQIVYPDGYLRAAFDAVRAAGGVCVADEVQVGFGRVGRTFWGFELHGVVPDVVTMGKPMGNGHPIAAVATTPEVAASFANGMEYFNTYGGNPVSAEIGLAVLDVLRDERLQARAGDVGGRLLSGLRELAARHPLVGDVRGEGLFLGVELVADRDARTPATAQARAVKEAVKAHGVLLSTDGPDDNVLKIKPPLAIGHDDCDFFLEALDAALAVVAATHWSDR